MKKDRYNKSAKKTIDLQISALNKLKKSFSKNEKAKLNKT